MITDDPKAKLNQVIEAASALVDHVVQSICKDPADPPFTYNPEWAARYEAIRDLNVVSAKGDDHLDAGTQHTDRFPAAMFFVDEIRRAPESEELAYASLGLRIECMGETFAIAQYELHEVFHAVRSILALDKSLGQTTGRGGVVEWNVWKTMQNLDFFVDDRRRPVVAASFFFECPYREVIYQ